MECGDTITLDSLLRRVLRTDGSGPSGCLAVAINPLQLADSVFPCEGPTALTRYAMAVVDDVLQVEFADSGEFEGLTCEQADIGIEELASSLAFQGIDTDAVVYAWTDDLNATDTCSSACDDSDLSLLEIVRSTVVTVGVVRYWRVILADEVPSEPLGCDFDGIGTETLIRMAIAKVGDGEYAWRYVVEA